MNIFLEYMSKQAKKEKLEIKESGPVITISREYGCYGTEIAKNLSEKITELSPNPWNYITKEILEESAHNLDVNKDQIAHVFGAKEKGFLGEIIMSFSGNKYKSDNLVKNTIKNVVRKYSEQGNTVIVGRAGCSIAAGIEKSLHVRIIAPFDYRVDKIQHFWGISHKKAVENVTKTDEERKHFMSFFKENRKDDEIFDLFLNRSRLTTEEIVEAIIAVAKVKKLI